ncbi:HPF/RaiA family ribosome-associated protein [Bradyrhizobium sp. B120]|uniref:HPF/RaiA family ribosome-associated protein n=1 Tax=Bradyrhizobium sp. B120 TaxID=3410088 RepID=UPI003B986B0B
MQTTVLVEFGNLTTPPELQAVIEQQICELERLYGRVSAGRITVRGPADRHEPGGQYQVSIRLALPNRREVNVGRTPKQDKRYADLAYALDDTFNQARNQLQDQKRLMGCETGFREGEPVGTVVRIDPGGAFGVLQSANGHEIYFSFISVLEGRDDIVVGSRVSYVAELGEDGLQAFAIKVRANLSVFAR